MGNRLNRIENTIHIPGRIIKTGLTTSEDVLRTLGAIPKDMGDVLGHTGNEIKKIIKSTWSKGKRYQKIGNCLLCPFITIGAAVEGAIRTVVTPATNFVKNTFTTGKNTISNTIDSTFGSIFSKYPVSDFKYEKLKTANVIKKNKNWFAKRRFGRKIFQENKGKDNKENNTKQPNKKVDENINNTEKNKDTSQDSTNIGKTKKPKEENKENSKENSEIIEKNAEHRGVNEAKQILDDSPCGKIIIDGLCANYEDFGIIFNNAAAYGSCNYDHTITIGTKMPSRSSELAPFNWEDRNPEFQKKHLLLHELGHCTVASHSQELPGIQKGLNIIQRYIDERKNIDGRTLSLLSYRNDIYETTWEKAREDFVEMLALRMNGNGNLCKKYLKLLSNEEHRSFRESHGLTKITKEDASKLQNIFDSIISYYENLNH